MKKRPGFTLAELMIAIIIFGFMITSLATIYSTSTRNMFQNYRGNAIKTNVGVAMRKIQNTLSVATRIDRPTKTGAVTDAGNILAFATNVDQTSGCYPVGPGSAAWHYFCVPAGGSILYYHTGAIPGGTGCAAAAPSTWNGPYPVAFCGIGGGGTVTALMDNAAPNPVFFSRRPTEIVLVNGVGVVTQGVTEQNTVRVMLRSFWAAAGNKAQRDVDFTMDTVIQVNRSAW
jgi:prepilin-type N-terminal cleavage/methylation domain-containing protein